MIHAAMVCAILIGAGHEVKDVAASYRVAGLEDRRFNHETLWKVLEPLVASPAIGVEQIGRSIQGRAIRALHFGRGSTRVLLWSQMHGDESTATMALADITRFLVEAEGDPLRERLGRELTITMVPMLNPDGAERFTRWNAIGVDVNRDARQQATPEGRALKTLRDRIAPQFGFNLHDQEARKLAGENGEQVAIALLAPAADEARTYGAVRSRARLVAATIVSALEGDIAGRIAKYDDAFTPRAFGDLMQSWGTSTVLIESGAIRGDVHKQELRRLNVIALLEALDAIATGSYRDAEPALYEGLPENERIEHDVIVRGGKVVFGGNMPFTVDVGVWFEDPVRREGARLGDVGDLADTGAVETIDAQGMVVHVETFGDDPGRLEHDEPVFIEVRRADGSLAHSFGAKPR